MSWSNSNKNITVISATKHTVTDSTGGFRVHGYCIGFLWWSWGDVLAVKTLLYKHEGQSSDPQKLM